jgi:hypothetical protein
MRPFRLLCLPFFSILVTLSAAHATLSDGDIARVYKQIETRRMAIMQAEADNPFPSPVCDNTKAGEHCLLGKINQGMALFYVARSPKDIAIANEEMRDVAAALPQAFGFSEENQDEEEAASPGRDWEPFHFMRAGILYRIVRNFGADGNLAHARLTSANEAAIDALFQNWASGNCRIADTNPDHLWTPWKSENHDAQHDATCWEAASLFHQSPQYSGMRYEDGSSPAMQYERWTAYLKTYIRARGRWGLIEFFSPTYAKYTLGNIYNYADFSDDPELKRLAKEFLDLWWAEWAQEQVHGIFGGAQTRVYVEAIAEGSPIKGVSWMYFGENGTAKDGREPGYSQAIASAYVPPPVVVDLALDVAGRGSYDVFARAPGLLAPGGRRSGKGNSLFTLDPGEPSVLRVAHVTPDFISSSALTARRPFKDWIPDSVQNRPASVTLTDDPQARIVVSPEGTKNPKNYNAVWALQSKATQIVQETQPPYGKNTGDMRIWFGAPLTKVERGGWVFAQGSAYVALHPAFGGYHWDGNNWLVLNDQASPVVIQAAPKADYPDFASFQTAVLNAPLEVHGGSLTFRGLDGAGQLTWRSSPDDLGEINGVPVEVAGDASLRSPFVNQASGSGTVRISKDNRSEVLDF